MKQIFTALSPLPLWGAFSVLVLLPTAAHAQKTPKKSPANVKLDAQKEGEKGILTANKVSYDGGKVIAQGTAKAPATYKSGAVTVTAQKVTLDTANRTISAEGTVVVERKVASHRKVLTPSRLADRRSEKTLTQTLRGDHFFYDYGKRTGNLDNVKVRLTFFNISAKNLTINGQKYIANHVLIRPGGLTPRELKIYGTPPLNLRARRMTLDYGKKTPANGADTANQVSQGREGQLSAEGAGLYFRNTKILPVPSYVMRHASVGGNRQKKAFSITPRVSAGSQDGFLVTTQVQYLFDKENPDKLVAVADLGLSARQGFRGGIGLDSDNKLGSFNVNAHVNDIVSNQIDDRVRLNRMPEFNYRAPGLPLFSLPGNRQAGLTVGGSWGKYRETNIDNDHRVESGRQQYYAKFTTRFKNKRGPYLNLFARHSRYSNFNQNYTTLGYEVGYYDSLTHFIDGQFSYTHTNISGGTPFTFDKVEIRNELRATFDIKPTPRWILPIDLRYDLNENRFRNKSYGILRNYKTFAYGLVYNTAHRELSLEIRHGF